MTWFVYILACNDGSFYVGRTQDVAARLTLHQSGKGAVHTAAHPPKAIAYQENFPTEREAARRERQLKRWSHAKKQALVEGNLALLHELSKSRD
jgi:putative endonuclease